MECTIVELNHYPLKSAKGISVPALEFTPSGPKWDRHWMLTKKNGQFVTQRTHPQMALIDCKMTSSTLKITLPSGETRQISLLPLEERQEELLSVSLFGKGAFAVAENFEISSWLSSFLGTEVQLVRSSELKPRKKISKVEKVELPIDFSDGYPVLLINSASVASFEKTISKRINPNRFRANIIVEGLEPFQEDSVLSFSNNSVTLLAEKACTRCNTIEINQETGTKEPLLLGPLKRERPSPKGPLFGQNLSIKISGQLWPHSLHF